jgi:cell wall-associated NlpC family hydrolase
MPLLRAGPSAVKGAAIGVGVVAAAGAAGVGAAVVAVLAAAAMLVGGLTGGTNIGLGGSIKTGSVPAQYVPLLTSAGATCPSVSPVLLAAQIRQESGFNPDAVSPAGAEGISQFLPTTWPQWGGDGDPFNPADAIPAQARYDCAIAQQLKDVPGDPTSLMLAGYNAGPFAVISAHGIPAIAETQNYVTLILGYVHEMTSPLSTSGGGSVGVGALTIGRQWLGLAYAWDAGNYDGPTVGVCTAGAAANDCHVVGFDCSGFVMAAFSIASHGAIHMAHSSEVMFETYPAIPAAEARPGDLVFASWGEDVPGLPGHVGIYEGGGMVLDAPHSGAFVRDESVSAWGQVTYARVSLGAST